MRDASGAVLPGVTVSVTGPNIARAQTTITSENGSYRIANLPPGTYVLTFELSGFRTVVTAGPSGQCRRRRSSRTSGSRSVSWLRASPSSAETPVVDTTSNEVGTTFDKDWVENAPSRRFGFYDLLAQAPGSVKGGDGTAAGERRTMSFGGSFDENAFQLDGVNVTDNFFSEGFSEPNPDTIEEVEVLSLGAPAEYGNLMGAVYNIVTKQGTNQFHGDASVFFQSSGLTSNNTKNVKFPNDKFADACADDPDTRCPWTRGDYYEATAQLGGPILRDRLWFFGSYGHQKDEFTRVGVNSELPGSAIDTTKDRVLVQRDLADDAAASGWSATSISIDRRATRATVSTRRRRRPGRARRRRRRPGVAYTATLSDKTLLDVRYSGFYGGVTGYPSDPSQPLTQPRIFNGDDRHDQRRQLLLVPIRRQPHHRHREVVAPCRAVPGRRAGLPLRCSVQPGRRVGRLRIQRFHLHLSRQWQGVRVRQRAPDVQLRGADPQHRRVRRRQHPARQSGDVEPGRAGRSQQRPLRRSRRSSTTMRQPTGRTFPRSGFLHLGQHVTPPGPELEGHQRRQDRHQVALGSLPSANHHRRVRQHHRSRTSSRTIRGPTTLRPARSRICS